MKRMGTLAAVTILAVTMPALAGCGKTAKITPPAASTGTVSGSGAPSSTSGSPTPSGSPTDLIEFTVDGAGPYQFQMNLAALRAKPGLDDVKASTDCPNNMTARGTGTWKDVQFSFHNDGTLFLAVNKSPNIPTPSGAWLGTTAAQLKTIYAGVTGQDLKRGDSSAFLVSTLSGQGILFELDPGLRVISMMAGDAAYLRNTFTGGGKYC
jgi:hypothetical protein